MKRFDKKIWLATPTMQGDEMKYALYMLDTNGCRLYPENFGEGMLYYNPDITDIEQSQGLFPDQLDFIEERTSKIGEAYGSDLRSMMFMHIPPAEIYETLSERYPDTWGTLPFSADEGEDIGMANEYGDGFETDGRLMKLAKNANCSGMFVGHMHKIALSIVRDGVRMTHGLKTGTSSYHDPEMIGTTKITISALDSSVRVDYLFTEIEYPA